MPCYLQPISFLLCMPAAVSRSSVEVVSALQHAFCSLLPILENIYPNIQFEDKSVFRNAYFFSAQVFTLATIKVAVKCSWHLNNAISSLCHTQFGLVTCNVFSRKCLNLLWDFCSFAFKVNCPYVWRGSVQDPSLFKTRLI